LVFGATAPTTPFLYRNGVWCIDHHDVRRNFLQGAG
jgi:hypothetical protein